MKSDKLKEVYWLLAIAGVTFVVGLLVFGSTLWDGEPADVHGIGVGTGNSEMGEFLHHDTRISFPKSFLLVAIFAVLLALVYGCRAVFGRTSKTFKVVAAVIAIVVIGFFVTGVIMFNQAVQEGMGQLNP
jgi:hypothetical protein